MSISSICTPESKGTPPPKPLPLRVPAIGTAGWNTAMA